MGQSAKKSITLHDVAKLAGVSINTVSRALNNRSDISEGTKELVLRKVDEAGYVSNRFAQNLRSGKSNTIAVLYDQMANPYYSHMIFLLAKYFAAQNFIITMFSTFSAIENRMDLAMAKNILSCRPAAIISFLEPEKDAFLYVKNKTEFLLLNRYDTMNIGVNYIAEDDYRCGYLAAEHLLEKGYRKIAYYTPDKSISVSKKRFEGFSAALADSGIKVDDSDVFSITDYDRDLKSVVKAIYERSYRAIFCFSDMSLINIYRECKDLNIRVAEDLALIGVDNIQEYFSLPIDITSVGYDNDTTAKEAVIHILNKLNRTAIDIKLTIQSIPVLIAGKTT